MVTLVPIHQTKRRHILEGSSVSQRMNRIKFVFNEIFSSRQPRFRDWLCRHLQGATNVYFLTLATKTKPGQRCRYSYYVTCCTVQGSYPDRGKIFFSSSSDRPDERHKTDTGVLFPEVKQFGREADHSDEVTNE